MRYLAVEYKNSKVNLPYKGYIRYPDDLEGNWFGPFINYLKAEKNAIQVSVYPLDVLPTPDTMGLNIVTDKRLNNNYTNIDNEFYNALADPNYYPRTESNDAIRRSFSKLDLVSSQYNIKAQL